MNFKHPEVVYLATRLYAQDLVLRCVLATSKELRESVLQSITMQDGLMLFEDITDEQRIAVISYARRMVSGPPEDSSAG